jgi:hypothetical protein
MKAPFRRLPIAITLTGIMLFALSGMAAANVTGKTLDTTACTSDANQQCATYGADGFTGTITFDASELNTTVTLADILCVNPVSSGGSFNSLGILAGPTATGNSGSSATYTLSINGVSLGTYTVPSGQDCSDTLYNPFTGGVGGVSFTITSTTVDYSLLISGVTAANANAVFGNKGVNFNSILNKIYELAPNGTSVSQANSLSVGPPEGPGTPVPEAPFTVLLLGTGVLTAVWYVSRKLRQSVSLTAA